MARIIEKFFIPFFMEIKEKISQAIIKLKDLLVAILTKITDYIKKWLNPKEITIKDYVRIGRVYIAKKLLIIIFLVMAILTYFIFIEPAAFINKLLNKPTVLIEETKAASVFSGKAEIYDTEENLIYEGDLKEGLYTGKGKLYNTHKQLLYSGEFKDGIKNGFGEEYVPYTGTLTYRGNFENGLKQGNGESFNLPGGLSYKGEHTNNSITGNGEIFNEAGLLLYSGSVENGVYSGSGKLYNKDLLVYEGEFKNGQYGGQGTTYYKNGNILYEGNFSNGLYAKEGTLYYSNGNLKYSGPFSKGKYHGEGVFHDKNENIIYEGKFKKGQYNGSGKLYTTDGTLQYEGTFYKKKYHRLGTLYDFEETLLYKGFFDNGTIAPWKFLGLAPELLVDIYGDPTKIISEEALNTGITSEEFNLIMEAEDPLNELVEQTNDDPENTEEEPVLPATYLYDKFGISFFVEEVKQGPRSHVTKVTILNTEIAKMIRSEIEKSIKKDKNNRYVKKTKRNKSGNIVVTYKKDKLTYSFQFSKENNLSSLAIDGQANIETDGK